MNVMGGTIIETESERLMRVGASQGAARVIVKFGQEDGLDDATIIKRLQENAGMSLDQASIYLKQYGKQLV